MLIFEALVCGYVLCCFVRCSLALRLLVDKFRLVWWLIAINFDNGLIIEVIHQAKMPNILYLQLLKCDISLFYIILNWKSKQGIWRCHFVLWDILTCIFQYLFICFIDLMINALKKKKLQIMKTIISCSPNVKQSNCQISYNVEIPFRHIRFSWLHQKTGEGWRFWSWQDHLNIYKVHCCNFQIIILSCRCYFTQK